jgi:hypothetical protein
VSYPYVQARYDYAVRKGPAFGLLYHMAEGGNTVAYLANDPSRGVSVHAVCKYDGTVVQMLDWTHASGSLNPTDRSTDKAYFGHKYLVDVLGPWWSDPNSAVLSMEIEGFASKGPNAAQMAAAVSWGLDMKGRFPDLRGAIGHADQTDTKACPGTTDAMKAIFSGVGGHGLWQGDDVRFGTVITGQLLPVNAGQAWKYLDGSPGGVFGSAHAWPVHAKADAHNGQYIVEVNTGSPYGDLVARETLVLVESTAALVDAPAVPAADCTDEVAAEHERVRTAALAAVGAV